LDLLVYEPSKHTTSEPIPFFNLCRPVDFIFKDEREILHPKPAEQCKNMKGSKEFSSTNYEHSWIPAAQLFHLLTK
jgi:hypothetical protein